MKWGAAFALAACSSAAPAPAQPVVEPVAIDAAVPDAAPDAGVPETVTNAPAWVFRYATAQRTETWTLQFAEGAALLEVQSAQGLARYRGTATDGASLALDVSTGTAKLALDCKRAKRALSTKCNDTRAKKLDVLDCYHPDFKEPMPFGPAPGVEYVSDATCTGYRLIAP
ncbi:MAG TPA: hypothetical protein VM513_09920 [Kofleriaceae bacterium]|nr:hypothetical protein [Kofleriaceae bacterium]